MPRKPQKKRIPRDEAGAAAKDLAKFAAYRHAVPEGVPPFIASLADEALSTIVKVMRGELKLNVRERLLAATLIRDEVCGDAAERAKRAANAGLPMLQVHIDLSPRSPADKAPPAPVYESDEASRVSVWQPVRRSRMTVNGVEIEVEHRGPPPPPPPPKPRLLLVEKNLPVIDLEEQS